MKTRNTLVALAVAAAFTAGLPLPAANPVDYTSYVDTRIGTDSNFGLSHGNTYPATGMPFAQHLWSAQTGRMGDGWKYQWQADEIRSFHQSHQCSPWVGDYGVYTLMPETGDLVLASADRGAKFSHDDEVARPHYYKVKFKNGITTEMAPTERACHMRFTFPSRQDAWMVVDGYKAMSSVTIDPEKREITGWVNNGGFFNHRETFHCWYVIRFDQPFEEWGTWENQELKRSEGGKHAEGKGYGAYVRFKKGTTCVNARVTSSYISTEQARRTLAAELGLPSKSVSIAVNGPDGDDLSFSGDPEKVRFKTFEQVCEQGRRTWNTLMGRVAVSGGTDEEMRTFYACLFRSNLFSRKFYEMRSDGTPYYYGPYDGEVHDGYLYTDNGFWDTFRSQFPLTNILHPTMQGRYMNAMLDVQDQCGWLPAWSCPGESGGMLGNHALSLLADAWAKGIRTFDIDRALKAGVHETMNKGPWGSANGRQWWKEYWQLGFVTYPESFGSTSQTLEYAYDDFCMYVLAKAAGNEFFSDIYGRSMYFYRNVFDPSTGFMRGRDKEGRWAEPFDPKTWGGPYCEADAWHYNWSVFQDVQGLIDLYGSDEAFVAKLDSVWTEEPVLDPGTYRNVIHEMKEMAMADMGQYAHGNQPIQHMPYLYCYAGQPWKTQYWVRRILSRLYNSGPQGYPGDEDQGGMSSWYVLSALGIYAVTPGTDQYVIGSPVFRHAAVTLENGAVFTVEAENNSPENVYIQSATLNGKPLEKNWITYSDISSGAALHLVMGPEPNRLRCTDKSAAPFSLSAG